MIERNGCGHVTGGDHALAAAAMQAAATGSGVFDVFVKQEDGMVRAEGKSAGAAAHWSCEQAGRHDAGLDETRIEVASGFWRGSFMAGICFGMGLSAAILSACLGVGAYLAAGH